MNRSAIREEAFKLIYSMQIQKQEELSDQIELYLESNQIESEDAKIYINNTIHGIEKNKEDIIALLTDKNVPGDDITYNDLADEIFENPPKQGYLTISNALQWRLQYKRVISLDNQIKGVVNFVW